MKNDDISNNKRSHFDFFQHYTNSLSILLFNNWNLTIIHEHNITLMFIILCVCTWFHSLGSIWANRLLAFFSSVCIALVSWYFLICSHTFIALQCHLIQRFCIVMTGVTHYLSLMIFECQMEHCLTSIAIRPRLEQRTIFCLIFSNLYVLLIVRSLLSNVITNLSDTDANEFDLDVFWKHHCWTYQF